jgi:hypothetical protein
MVVTLGYEHAIKFQHDGFEFNDGAKPRHDFDVGERLKRYGADDRIIYLHRDPRDTMVSLFHQVKGRFRDFYQYEGDISAFIRDEYFGAHVLAQFRNMWSQIVQQRNCLVVAYEDMHANGVEQLRRVVSFLDLTVGENEVVRAVRAGRLENMRAVEQGGTFPEPWLRPRDGFTKVRSGMVGGYRHELDQADVQYLNGIFGLGQ